MHTIASLTWLIFSSDRYAIDYYHEQGPSVEAHLFKDKFHLWCFQGAWLIALLQLAEGGEVTLVEKGQRL